MPTIDFSVRFIVDRVTPQVAIELTDASDFEGATLVKGNFKVTYPNAYIQQNADFNTSPDISAELGQVEYPAQLGNINSPITGTYNITYTTISDGFHQTVTKTFVFDWAEPDVIISDNTDVVIPDVQWSDRTISDQGNWSEVSSSYFEADFPSTSSEAGNSKTSNTSTLDMSNISSEYFEGIYDVTLTSTVTSTSTTDSYLSIYWTRQATKQFDVRRVERQSEIIALLSSFKRLNIDPYKGTNDVRYEENLLKYGKASDLYVLLIDRFKADLQADLGVVYNELLAIIEDYTTAHAYQSTPLERFELIPLEADIDVELIQDTLAGTIVNGTGLGWTYDDLNNTLTGNVNIAPFSTDDLSEGANLYYTNERVDDRLSIVLQDSDLGDTNRITFTYDDTAGTIVPVLIIPPPPLNEEAVDDRVAAFIQDSAGGDDHRITWTYDDAAGTYTPTVTVTLDVEGVDDRVAALIQGNGPLSWTYDDVSNTLTPTFDFDTVDDRVAGLLQDNGPLSWAYDDIANTLTPTFDLEYVDDRVAGFIQTGSPISWTYDDVANTLTPVFDFDTVDDRVATLIQNGDGITWAYDDTLNTLTPTILTEYINDVVNNLIIEGTGIKWFYNDGNNTLQAELDQEVVDDRIAGLLQPSSGINWNYNDSLNTLTPEIVFEDIQDDIANNLIEDSDTVTWTYDDINNSLKANATFFQTGTITLVPREGLGFGIGSPGGGTSGTADYSRVGNLVHVSGSLQIDQTDSGILRCSGFPYRPTSVTITGSWFSSSALPAPGNGGSLFITDLDSPAVANDMIIYFRTDASGGNMLYTDFDDRFLNLYFSLTYITEEAPVI